ncbi:MAG: histidine kinase [Burkholderiales bacterium]
MAEAVHDQRRRLTALQPIDWSVLWRGGLLALVIVLALSTQLLFQFDLYEHWALGDIVLGWLDHLLDQLIVGASVFAAVTATVFIPTSSNVRKHALVFVAIVLGAIAGEMLMMQRLPPAPDISVAGLVAAKVARWVVIAGLGYLLFVFNRQTAAAARALHEAELQRIHTQQQLTEARLQSLRAQIEPHFLFNTLANVQRLYRTEPDLGRRMLGNFVAYLRAALTQMRGDTTTLQQEVDLARAYLDVLQVRMGKRLRVRFEVPPALAMLPFPPLALSTLTENAIKHGLNPLPEGGSIEIRAQLKNGFLSVGVADTGAGLQGASGTGTGLANLRARLSALYGEAANLEVEANSPRGIRATIAIPVPALP